MLIYCAGRGYSTERGRKATAAPAAKVLPAPLATMEMTHARKVQRRRVTVAPCTAYTGVELKKQSWKVTEQLSPQQTIPPPA